MREVKSGIAAGLLKAESTALMATMSIGDVRNQPWFSWRSAGAIGGVAVTAMASPGALLGEPSRTLPGAA